MPGVFISYRQGDSKAWAAFLRDELGELFGHEHLFLDRDTLVAGSWRQQIDESLEQCAVTLLVIGRGWLDARNAEGRRRLDDPDDVHRHEIAQALARPGMTLIPVLVDGAQMPPPSALPSELRALCEQQARLFSDNQAHREADVRLLAADLQRSAGLVPRRADLALPLQRHLLPQLDEVAARKAFADWATGLLLAPSDFAAKATLAALTPHWFPVWHARASVNVFWRGRRGDKRETQETSTDANGKQVSKTVTHTDWTEVQGEFKAEPQAMYFVACALANSEPPPLLAAGSKSAITAAAQLPTFGSDATLVPQTIDERQVAEKVNSAAAAELRSKVNERIGGAVQDIKSIDVHVDKLDLQLVQVPAFDGRYGYGGVEYAVTINAATGAVGGPSPISKTKAGAAVAIGAAVLVAIGLLIWYMMRR